MRESKREKKIRPLLPQIVLDMGKYSSGQITVETQGFFAVVKGENGDLTYHRRFPLPRDTNTDRVVADLSDEGILTVSAPRRVSIVVVEEEEESSGLGLMSK